MIQKLAHRIGGAFFYNKSCTVLRNDQWQNGSHIPPSNLSVAIKMRTPELDCARPSAGPTT